MNENARFGTYVDAGGRKWLGPDPAPYRQGMRHLSAAEFIREVNEAADAYHFHTVVRRTWWQAFRAWLARE